MTHIVETSKLTPVIAAGQNLLNLIDTGDLLAGNVERAAAAADALQEAIDVAVREISAGVAGASPFLRHRRAILRRDELQHLVTFLFNGDRLNFFHLFSSVTAEEKVVALVCIAHYAEHGENDPHFMQLASEIFDLRKAAA